MRFFLYMSLILASLSTYSQTRQVIGKCKSAKAVLKIENFDAATDFFELRLDSGELYSLPKEVRTVLGQPMYLDNQHANPLERKISHVNGTFCLIIRNEKDNHFLLNIYSNEEKRTLIASLPCE